VARDSGGHNTNFAGSQSAIDRAAREQSGEDSANLPDPDVLAQEIVEDREITTDLSADALMEKD